jgi:hypothetical protein
MRIWLLDNYTQEELNIQTRVSYELRCKESIEYFSRKCLNHLLTSKIPKFHTEIYNLLTENKRLVIAAPRGFAKSYICSIIYPIWIGIHKKYSDVTIISASETLAKEMLRKIKREFESNQIIRDLYGDLITDKWSETHATLSTGVTFRARGSEGQIRGFRPDCIILDDIETDETVKSEEQRKKISDWIFKACLPALTPNGQFLIVGSIISQLAVLKQIMDSDNKWEKRLYKAYENEIEESGKELWVELWPHDRLQQRKKEIGSWAFYSEYMNNPRGSDTTSIPINLIRKWKDLPSQLSCVIAVDPAYSEEEKADWKVASLIGIDQQMNRYLIHYIRTHAPQGEFIDAVLSMWQSNKTTVTALGIPCQGLESEIFRSFVNKANERKMYPPFVELKNTFITSQGVAKRGKASRIIAALQPLFEQGKYYIGESHQEAFEELASLNPNLDQRWDDLCLAKGTMIATEFGDKPIENIKIGDRVITPQGIQSVTACGFTGIKKTIFKLGLHATTNHKIFSSTQGIVSIDTICYDEEASKLNLKELLRWRYQKLLYSMEENSTLWVGRENIICLMKLTKRSEKILKDFMWQFGSFIIKGELVKAFIFITEMVILLITVFLILSAYRLINIFACLRKLIWNLFENIWKGLDHWLYYGIDLRKVVYGINSILLIFIRILNLEQRNVLFAIRNTDINIQHQDFVLQHASKNMEGIVEDGMRKEIVLSVEESSLLINIKKIEPVQNHVDINISQELKPVYNLTIENEGLYYANGVLVSNCDTMAYAESLLQPVFISQETKFEKPEHKIPNNYGWE